MFCVKCLSVVLILSNFIFLRLSHTLFLCRNDDKMDDKRITFFASHMGKFKIFCTIMPVQFSRVCTNHASFAVERKRRTNVKEKPQIASIRNQNESALPRKKDSSLKKFDLQTTRSPLSLLGHSNSPEPKRIRQTVSFVTQSADTLTQLLIL